MSIKSQIISGSVLYYVVNRKDKSSATSSDLTVCCQCASFADILQKAPSGFT